MAGSARAGRRGWLVGVVGDIEAVLRFTLASRPWWAGVRVVVMTSPVAGLAAGSFSVDGVERAPLMVYSAVKMPLLILCTTALCLPGLYAVHVVLGARHRFAAALRGILGGQAVFAVALAAMSPLIAVWYTAVESKRAAVMGNAAVFGIAAAASLVMVRRSLRRAAGDRRLDAVLLAWWLMMYAFVGVQVAWMLRPFIGSPGVDPGFLRGDALTNGYVVVFRMISGG